MIKRDLDRTLSKFLADILLWVLRVLLFVTFISKLETSSFVAILGAMGLAVGLSLQGSLSNFAGGMLIILFKPFRVGDLIEAQGIIATVNEIQIFVTKHNCKQSDCFRSKWYLMALLLTSMEQYRRADLVFSISYDANIKKQRHHHIHFRKQP
jgi:small conductance mechanosensitive channel